MTDERTRMILEEWAAKDAHYAAHPVAIPRAQDGQVITVGQRVRHEPCLGGTEGIVTEVRIRCYGDPRTESVRDYSLGIDTGEQPAQQVWVFFNDRNCIHRPGDVIEVLA